MTIWGDLGSQDQTEHQKSACGTDERHSVSVPNSSECNSATAQCQANSANMLRDAIQAHGQARAQAALHKGL